MVIKNLRINNEKPPATFHSNYFLANIHSHALLKILPSLIQNL